jgi:threonine/homoserine/homoserine lactone efflux protein
MTALLNFLLAFSFSFAGSIPPGTINLSVVQLGLSQKTIIAVRLAFAASLIEYPYAWISVEFEKIISASPVIVNNLQLIAAVVMTALGLLNVIAAQKEGSPVKKNFEQSGFRRGIVIGVLNPLAIPYWLAITAYLKSQNWIDVSDAVPLHAYLFGVFSGAFTLLSLLAFLSQQTAAHLSHSYWIRKVPGWMLVVLGVFAFIQYFTPGD